MIDAMSAPQIEETAEYLAWVERVESQNEILESVSVSLETVNRMLAEMVTPLLPLIGIVS